LVEARSFTKAAQRMHISQPALTAAIQKLERELHTELLVRTGHGFTLTAAGRIAYDAAKDLTVRMRNLRVQLLEATRQKVALTVGTIDSIAELLFVQGSGLRQIEQNAQLSLTINNSAQLVLAVEHDELDVAVIAEPPHTPPNLRMEIVGEEPLVLVTSREQLADVRQALLAGQLKQFLAYNHNSQTYQLVERFLEQHGIAVQPSFYSTSPEIMLQLVLAGQGTAVLPYLLVRGHLQTGTLKMLHIGDEQVITRRIVSIRRAGRAVPAAAQQLLQQATDDLRLLATAARNE